MFRFASDLFKKFRRVLLYFEEFFRQRWRKDGHEMYELFQDSALGKLYYIIFRDFYQVYKKSP